MKTHEALEAAKKQARDAGANQETYEKIVAQLDALGRLWTAFGKRAPRDFRSAEEARAVLSAATEVIEEIGTPIAGPGEFALRKAEDFRDRAGRWLESNS